MAVVSPSTGKREERRPNVVFAAAKAGNLTVDRVVQPARNRTLHELT